MNQLLFIEILGEQLLKRIFILGVRILLPLIIGLLVYVLFRPPLSWLPSIRGWNEAIIDLSALPSFLSTIIKFHLSDVLWALSFAEALYIISKNKALAVIFVFISTIVFETGQYFNLIRGTGDFWDVVSTAAILAVYIVILTVLEGKQHEKNS